MNRQYKVSELRRIIKESTNELKNPNQEFKPTMYNDDNKKINDKAYKDMEKATKNYDGKARVERKNINYPFTDNRGMEDIQYDNINQKFIDDNKSRRKGYVNKQAEDAHKNDPFGNAEFHDFDGIDDHVKMIKDGETTAKEIGLTSREIPKKKFEDQHKTVDESKTMKLTFKNTTFLTEQHMLSRVPDNYKVEGKKFIMRDKMNHEYLVEWHVEDDPYVLNKTQINEQQNRIKELFNYKRGESNTTNAMRLTEDKKVNDMLNKARKLMM